MPRLENSSQALSRMRSRAVGSGFFSGKAIDHDYGVTSLWLARVEIFYCPV